MAYCHRSSSFLRKLLAVKPPLRHSNVLSTVIVDIAVYKKISLYHSDIDKIKCLFCIRIDKSQFAKLLQYAITRTFTSDKVLLRLLHSDRSSCVPSLSHGHTTPYISKSNTIGCIGMRNIPKS